MTSPSSTNQPAETVDARINRAIRIALDHRGDTLAAFGRRLDIPASTWARKTSDRPGMHQAWKAEEVARVAAALGLTPNDLFSGQPMLTRWD